MDGATVISWVRRCGVPDRDAEDVAQDVFLNVVRSGIWDGGWIRTVTRNTARDYHRRQKIRRAVRSVPGTELANVESPARTPTVELVDQFRALERVFTQVRPLVKLTTWQSFWETTVGDRDAGDVAVELGLSADVVRKNRQRVIVRVRELLTSRGQLCEATN